MNHRHRLLWAALGITSLLTGCLDDTPSLLEQVPGYAIGSESGTVTYQQQLAALQSETDEPIDVSDLRLRSSEDSEPQPVE